ncbi:MAG: squalene/phytoene synthase family protein [Gemmobacter sp.]
MSLDHCAALVEVGDPDRWATVLAAPVAARAALIPLYALNLEIARAPWASAEPLVAEMRVQWWRDRLAEIGAGGAVPGHPVLAAAAGLVDAGAAAILDRMADARRWDIWREPFADAAALEAHVDATAGGLMWLATRALGAPDAAEGLVRDVAAGQGMAAWLMAVPALAARGRAPLPDPTGSGIAALARAARARLVHARRRRAALPRSAAPALLPAWMAAGVLARAAADPGLVAAGALAPAEAARRLGLLWRALSGRW